MPACIALQVAATAPLALDSSGLDPAIVAREKAVLADKNAGKPANVLEKIVESGLKTYYKEVCLLDQPSIHAEHANKTIGQVVKEAEKAAGAPVVLKGFVRFALGEGIEKHETDFAAEVAAAAGPAVSLRTTPSRLQARDAIVAFSVRNSNSRWAVARLGAATP